MMANRKNYHVLLKLFRKIGSASIGTVPHHLIIEHMEAMLKSNEKLFDRLINITLEDGPYSQKRADFSDSADRT